MSSKYKRRFGAALPLMAVRSPFSVAGTRRTRTVSLRLLALCLLVAVGGFTLAACSGGGEATPRATNAPIDSPAARLSPPAQATPTAEERTPTASPESATPTTEAQQTTTTEVSLGSAVIRDNFARSDQLFVNLANLPPLEPGQVYAGWLAGYEGTLLQPIGAIPVDAEGKAQLTFDAPSRANLLADYDGFILTIEQEPIPESPSSPFLSWSQVSLNVMEYIRRLLVSSPDTPENVGLAIGLVEQVGEVVRQAQYARDSAQAGDLDGIKQRAEQIILLIEGPGGPNYRDLDGDGEILDPGDTFGLLEGEGQVGYVQAVAEAAKGASEAAFANEVTKLHSRHVQDAAANTGSWLIEVRDTALTIFEENDLSTASDRVQQMVVLAERALNGFDADNDESIEPIPGEGGAKIAYQHSQFMAEMPLVLQSIEMDSPPPAATPTSPQQSESATTITMSDFSYVPSTITVKVGTTVTFVNQDGVAHTATADGGEFDTGVLRANESADVTFSRAGTFRFHCQFHGGAGGQGMAGTIVVEP